MASGTCENRLIGRQYVFINAGAARGVLLGHLPLYPIASSHQNLFLYTVKIAPEAQQHREKNRQHPKPPT